MKMSPGLNDQSSSIMTPDSVITHEQQGSAKSPIDLIMEDAEHLFVTQTIEDVEVTPTDILELLQM